MPFRIQRVPRGLNDLLSIFGGQTPTEMEDRLRATLDLLQVYSLTQLQKGATNNAAAAANANVNVSLGARWSVLFAASCTVVKTATVTALRGAVLLNRSGQQQIYASAELGPFGATDTGPATVVFVPSYPLLCPPNTVVTAIAQIIGTDATANVTCSAEFGVLG